MRSLIILVLAGASLTSCYTWKRGFVHENTVCFKKCKEKRDLKKYSKLKTEELNPMDFVYLRQVEYFELIDNSEASEGVEPYSNEVASALYKSVPLHYNLKRGERLVEEKYMCLQNISKPSIDSGAIYYFRTATYWGEGKNSGKDDETKNKLRRSVLKQHFEDTAKIDISTSKELQLGYWFRNDSVVHMILNNGTNSYEAIGKWYEDSMVIEKISHPNKEDSEKNVQAKQLIELSKVMNVQGREGLVYYRNVNASGKAPQRSLCVTYLDANNAVQVQSVDSISYQQKRKRFKSLDQGKSFLKLSDNTILEQRKKYHSTWVVSDVEQRGFAKSGEIPTREELELEQELEEEKQRQKEAAEKEKEKENN
jgi:hypothetical protein